MITDDHKEIIRSALLNDPYIFGCLKYMESKIICKIILQSLNT